MIKDEAISTGDIGVVVRPGGKLGKLISLFTSKLHTFHFVREYGKLYVYEMSNEITRSLYSSTYANLNNWELLKPNIPYTETQKARCVKFSTRAYQIGYKYDTCTLIKHGLFEISGRMPLETKDDKKLICSQLTALMANYCEPYSFGAEETISPEIVYKSKKYYKVKNN